MERCILTKRSMAIGGLPLSSRAPRSSPTNPSPFLLVRSFSRILAMATSEDFGLQWQPAFRFEKAELMADAPSLLKTCGDFDWKAQANELRALAQLSLPTNKHPPSSNFPPKDVGESTSKDDRDMWFAAGLALATAALVQASFHFNALALATEELAEKTEAASRAPSWLTPALLAFPVVTYGIFYVYRSQVNPSAKVTDWMFGVAATVIIANLVLISTLGVRLY